MTEASGLDIEAIIERLPHRHSFLFVDRVLRVVPGGSIVAVKNVTFHEPHFPGHFPNHPVMPGVLIVEALAQASGVLAYESLGPDERNVRILYLVGIENARFKAKVRPGDQLILKAELTKRKRNIWFFHCVAEVDGKVAAEADVLMAAGNPA